MRVLPFIYQRPPPRNGAERRALASFAEAMASRYGRNGAYWRERFPVDAVLRAFKAVAR